MITLIAAFKLCGIRDDEVFFLRNEGVSRHWHIPMTGREARNKLDMKKTMVIHISPAFSFGEYEGMEFEIRRQN